jgi:hypothetical protein
MGKVQTTDYGWTARPVLDEIGSLIFFAAIALASTSALVAWRAFWRSKW